MFEPSETDRLLIAARLALGADKTDEAAMLLDRVLALEPANPMALTMRAEPALDRRAHDQALRLLDQALAAEPNFAPAWYHRTRALWFTGRHAQGLESARHAASVQPGNLLYRLQHAQLAAWMGYRREAQDVLRPLRDDKTLPAAERALVDSALGEAAIAAGRGAEASRYLARALRLNPDMRVTRMMLGMHQLRRGEFPAGWPNYAAREGIKYLYPDGPPRLPGDLWTGQDLRGRSIVVIDDQGHGDSIQFFRYLRRLRALGASQVTLLTFPGLERLYRQASADVTILCALPAETQADYHCNSTALLRWLGVVPEAEPDWAPYLFAPARSPLRLPRARRVKRVGLAWSGDPAHTRDHLRSIPAAVFLTLMDVPGIAFHSLQPVVRPADEPALRRRKIGRSVEAAADFADTAALIEGLDLVVAVDTGVAHLAAAMGKPVWMVLHSFSDWRWLLRRDDSPWYPTMRLFRGRADEWGDGDMGWAPLIGRVTAALRGFVKG
jgi:tetratricopeptide (TPR) repeat protein